MAVNIGPKIGIDGEKQFRQELTDINRLVKQYASETKALTSAYEGNEDSLEAMTAKSQAYTKQLEAQRQAVAKTEEVYEKVKTQLGENSDAAKRWESELVKQRAELTRLENQLGQTQTKLEQFAEGFQKASQNLSSAGNALTLGLTTPLLAAGAAAVNYASDTEESLNKVDVAFGSSSAAVRAWSEQTLTSIGLARGTALDMAALFGDMATSMGYSQDAAADMSTELVNLAGDLASFKNISIDEAATALKSIFTGETESLKNLGVVMTETNLEAYAMSKGLTKAYSAMTETEKVALRYEYVLAKTTNAQGDFARTSDSTANQLRVLQESLKEAAASLGTELLPIVTPVIQRIGELVQKLSGLDDTTKSNIVRAGLWLATLGPALKLTGGLTTAVNAGITAYKALKSAQTAATTAQTALNAAQAASPLGAIVTGVGAVVAALTAYGVTSALTADATETMTDKVKEAQVAFSDTADDIRAQSGATQSLIGSLENLLAVEDKTAAQKQMLLGIVEELNEAIPELSLAYDEQTDSINMTADAVRKLAEAEAYRQLMQSTMEAITEQYQLQAEAEQNLAELRDQEIEWMTRYTDGAGNVKDASFAAYMDLLSLNEQMADQQSAAAAAEDAIAQLTAEYEEYAARAGDAASSTDGATSSLDDSTDAAENNADALEDDTSALEEQTDAAEELRKATESLASSADTLTSALEEQTSSGSLSLQTALDLIDAGYAAALAIDQETGAIQLNERSYIALAKAKIDEQLASAEAERAHIAAAEAALADTYAAMENAGAYYQVAEAKAAAEGKIKSYDAEIGALKQAKAALENYTFSVKTASTTSTKATTQAEKNLDKYKDIRAEYDYLLAMGEITEEEYYKKLAEIRDQYLTDSDNIEEYRKINEEIYKYDKELAEKEDELWATQTEALVSELQSRLDDVVSARDDMAAKLADYGDLFTQSGELIFTVNDLQSQIDALNQYEQILNRLQESGISSGLLGEVTSMDVDDAIKYGAELLAMAPDQWEEYNRLWEEKQQRAIEIATQFYQDQLDTLQTEYDEKLGTALDGIVTTAYDSGVDTAQGLADGISDNAAAAIEAAAALATQIAEAMNAALDINSPSGVTEETGKFTAQGFEVGYVDEMRDIRDRIARGTSLEDTANTAAAGIVNGLASLPQTGGTYQINIKVGSAELASVLFDPLRGVIKQRGESLG